MEQPDRPALVVIDVQCGFDDSRFWGPRNNPACEENIASLLELWRANQWPVVLVRHDSTDPHSPLAMGQAGNDFKEFVNGASELLISKSVNSAFHGTPDLDTWLRSHGVHQVVICGITTNHCCETTARISGNLGYETFFVIDATHTFDREGVDGSTITAETLSSVTAANLHREFATVITTQALHDAWKR